MDCFSFHSEYVPHIVPCVMRTHVSVCITHGIIIPIVIPMVCDYTHVCCASLFFTQKFGQKVHMMHNKIQYFFQGFVCKTIVLKSV